MTFKLDAGVLVGAVVIHDKVKPEAKETIKILQSMNVRVALLTGDNRRTALAIAQEVSILCQSLTFMCPTLIFHRLEYQTSMFVLKCCHLIRRNISHHFKKGRRR